jgi:hypothetical protein
MMLLTDIPPFSVTSVYSVRDKWPIGIKTLIASRKRIHLSATGRPALWAFLNLRLNAINAT